MHSLLATSDVGNVKGAGQGSQHFWMLSIKLGLPDVLAICLLMFLALLLYQYRKTKKTVEKKKKSEIFFKQLSGAHST